MAQVQSGISRRRVQSRFDSLAEWSDWLKVHASPARPDDTPVLADQSGPPRRAGREELMALVEHQRARYAADAARARRKGE
jgi:hypothetical protein